MKNETDLDPFLGKRLVNYDRWMANGKISFSSKVIPVSESFDAKQWVMPTEQVLRVLENAESIALQDCECRTHYKRCEKPLETCLLLNAVADKAVARGQARRISSTEAGAVLKRANESGLVHMSLYMPNHEIYALCSCCACCCHELQIIKQTGRHDILRRSDYLAVTDCNICIHCGGCVERCHFKARIIEDAELKFDPEKCVGCGLCITTCPVEAIAMITRRSNPSANAVEASQ